MDTERFDNLVRSLFAGQSRRRLLAGLIATLPAASGAMESNAKKRKKKKKKKKKQCTPNCAGKSCGGDGCGGLCGTCSSGQDCDGGTCVCPPARVCGATCCPAGQICAGGLCRGPGTCQPSDNLCAAVATCNGNAVCGCLSHFTDGAVLCATSNPDGCAINCQNDADCVAFGANAFCVKKVGEICCFGLIPLNQGFCALPCPT